MLSAKLSGIEIQRIVVAVGNIGVKCRMVGRDEPVPRAHAGNQVEERESVVLRGRESQIGALRIVVAAAAGRAPRLNQTRRAERGLSARRRNSPPARIWSRARESRTRDLSSMSPERSMMTCALPQPSEHLNLFRLLNAALARGASPASSRICAKALSLPRLPSVQKKAICGRFNACSMIWAKMIGVMTARGRVCSPSPRGHHRRPVCSKWCCVAVAKEAMQAKKRNGDFATRCRTRSATGCRCCAHILNFGPRGSQSVDLQARWA